MPPPMRVAMPLTFLSFSRGFEAEAGRFGTPDEIAKAVVLLASDDCSYITGIELFVDYGFAQV